ncbi:MAG TPA: prepilin-type N-terminal cleavage/methylation domain-containing protein [Anaeromyxobacter sp.]|nr:prepilin-type N-terminal cleavage/methylation domain-containing protein [Anaeromyxobacter sp.]
MSPRTVRRASGFTLIELMVVTAIVGILSSVAVPAYTLLTMRSRTAERALVMNSIKRGVVGLYLRDGKVALAGAPNPPGANPPGTSKVAFQNRLDAGWITLSEVVEFEGAMYYQYDFTALEPGGNNPATLTTHAAGDLDGDGISSELTVIYERREGQYWTDEKDTTGQWCQTAPTPGCIEGGGLDAGTF